MVPKGRKVDLKMDQNSRGCRTGDLATRLPNPRCGDIVRSLADKVPFLPLHLALKDLSCFLLSE